MRVLWLVGLGLCACGAKLGSLDQVIDGAAVDQPVIDPDDNTDAPLGAWGPPVAVGGITPATDDDPSATGDLLELYFNRNNDIFLAKRAAVTDPFTVIGAVAELDTASTETTPEVSYDGLTMLLASNRAPTEGGLDIWKATRATRNDPWGTPVHDDQLSTANREAGPASGDALTVVFESDRSGTSNDTLIATRATTADPFGPATPVDEVNTATFSDGNPMLSADGLELYINSDRSGNNEIYVATRASTAVPFDPPVLITQVSDGAADDQDPWISPDKRTLLFTSDRVGGIPGLFQSTR